MCWVFLAVKVPVPEGAKNSVIQGLVLCLHDWLPTVMNNIVQVRFLGPVPEKAKAYEGKKEGGAEPRGDPARKTVSNTPN